MDDEFDDNMSVSTVSVNHVPPPEPTPAPVRRRNGRRTAEEELAHGLVAFESTRAGMANGFQRAVAHFDVPPPKAEGDDAPCRGKGGDRSP